MKVLIIPGSLRENSYNKSVAMYVKENFSQDCDFEVLTLNDFPMFNEDLENALPQKVFDAIELIKNSDGLIFITPEYNNSLPAPIRNLVHWLSRSYSKKFILGKPLGIIGVTDGGFGTVRAQNELLLLATVVGFKVNSQMRLPISNALEIFDAAGNLTDTKVKSKIKTFIEEYLLWLKS